MRSTFYAIIKLTVEHEGDMEDARRDVGSDADYHFSFDNGKTKIVDTEWSDIRTGDEL
jgi:hypothetical protein